MTEIRIILLVGTTKSGKSALANVLTNSNKFRESNRSISETQNVQMAEFELDLPAKDGESENSKKAKYLVIDTPGFNHTKLSDIDIAARITEVLGTEERVSCVFFVFDGRFREAEFNIFNALELGKKGKMHLTFIRNHFEKFRSRGERERDAEELGNENSDLAEIIDMSEAIIYIDNPSPQDELADTNKKRREKSRELLIEYLQAEHENLQPFVYEDLQKKIRPFLLENQNPQRNWAKVAGGGIIIIIIILILLIFLRNKMRKKGTKINRAEN